MSSDFNLYAKMDGLPPTEKLRDSKGRVVREELPPPKKKGKRKQEGNADIDAEEKEGTIDSPEEKHSGKIVDIII
jgi:hypothetical protein